MGWYSSAVKVKSQPVIFLRVAAVAAVLAYSWFFNLQMEQGDYQHSIRISYGF